MILDFDGKIKVFINPETTGNGDGNYSMGEGENGRTNVGWRVNVSDGLRRGVEIRTDRALDELHRRRRNAACAV